MLKMREFIPICAFLGRSHTFTMTLELPAAGNVNDTTAHRGFHRRKSKAEALNPGLFLAERFLKRLAQGNADVLVGVMDVNVRIAGHVEVQVKIAVKREQFQ